MPRTPALIFFSGPKDRLDAAVQFQRILAELSGI
jgi:hypothetical protein